MKAIKVKLHEHDIDSLDRQAAIKGVSRSELIRERALRAPGSRQYTPQDYAQLVSSACRRVDLPRAQVERLVNVVFVELMGPREEEASPA